MHLQAWVRCDHPWKLMPWPTPDNVFSRAVMPWPSRENPFTGAGALPAPANNICSCKRQERVSLPPLQMLFYPPYKCFFVVVLEDAMWMPGLLLDLPSYCRKGYVSWYHLRFLWSFYRKSRQTKWTLLLFTLTTLIQMDVMQVRLLSYYKVSTNFIY